MDHFVSIIVHGVVHSVIDFVRKLHPDATEEDVRRKIASKLNISQKKKPANFAESAETVVNRLTCFLSFALLPT